MHIQHAIVLATLLMVAGCGDRHTGVSQAVLQTNENQWFFDRTAEAARFESNASVVLEVWGTTNNHAVRLKRPAPAVTNELVHLADFQTALASVQRRGSAVIEMYAMGFDTNRLTNAAAQLRQGGFRDIRTVVLRWGGVWIGPAL